VRNQFPDGESRAARQTRIATADAEWTRSATQLTQLVLAPFGPFHARRIAVVVDGALAHVPFVVLPVTSRAGRLDPSKPCAPANCALGRSVEVVTLPSASVLAELRRGRATRAPRTLRAAVLADPVFRADDPRVSHVAGASETTTASTASADQAIDLREGGLLSPETLTRLPYSREEASAIATLAGKDVFVGLDFDASRATIDAGKLGRPDVLHIATHAMVDEAQPELSGIVLSLVDKQGARVRGFLPLVEVYDLPVSANLVVLSACRTAAGPDVRGEGLVSLTRGFMYAGTPRVIASLWSIEDEATAAFMRSFYEAFFTKHLSPSAALKAAQQTMQRTPKWASPYYWAAFAFHGDWE
jgi:CHAT domain-containing protein